MLGFILILTAIVLIAFAAAYYITYKMEEKESDPFYVES